MQRDKEDLHEPWLEVFGKSFEKSSKMSGRVCETSKCLLEHETNSTIVDAMMVHASGFIYPQDDGRASGHSLSHHHHRGIFLFFFFIFAGQHNTQPRQWSIIQNECLSSTKCYVRRNLKGERERKSFL